MTDFSAFHVAIIATDGFEEAELTVPLQTFEKNGIDCQIVAPNAGQIQGYQHLDLGRAVPVDQTLASITADQFDAVILPGGTANSDALRMNRHLQGLLRTFQRQGKPIGAVCHAPWLLVSAELVRGRRLTSFHTIQDDIRNAGGTWVDAEVVIDHNLVTSRKPDDLPAFCRELMVLFRRQARRPDATVPVARVRGEDHPRL